MKLVKSLLACVDSVADAAEKLGIDLILTCTLALRDLGDLSRLKELTESVDELDRIYVPTRNWNRVRIILKLHR